MADPRGGSGASGADDIGVFIDKFDFKSRQRLNDSTEVEFIARSRVSNAAAVRQHERSRFVREGGRWFYVDGDKPTRNWTQSRSEAIRQLMISYLRRRQGSREALRRAKPDLLAHAVPIMRGVLLT
jgi:hypothetical protein